MLLVGVVGERRELWMGGGEMGEIDQSSITGITTQYKNSQQSTHLYIELSSSLTKNIYRQNSIT